jgi:GNAT superfamily N-acetyltransferase
MDYSFRNTNTDTNSIKLYSELLSLVFPETKKYTVNFLNWQYNLNPYGKVVGYDAFFNDELAAHYVTIPVVYSYRSEQFKGLLSLNTATHPKHQGKKLFTQLAAKTYEYAAQQGYQFVIGVANQNSTHGFITKLGFELISPLEVNMFLGKSGIYPKNQDLFHSEWNERSINWRLNNPEAAYFENHGTVICNTHIKYIKAVLSQQPNLDIVKFDHATAPVKMTIGLNLKNKGWFNVNLPDKYKPSPLNLILKPLGDFSLGLNKSNIYFELIDFDAY